MSRGWVLRALGGAGAALLGLVLAVLLGAPLTAALLAFLAGLAAWALVGIVPAAARAPEPAIETTGLPPLPEAIDLLEAVDNPILINRPLVETEKGVRLCRPQEKVREIL